MAYQRKNLSDMNVLFKYSLKIFSYSYKLNKTFNLVGHPKKMAGQVYFSHKEKSAKHEGLALLKDV